MNNEWFKRVRSTYGEWFKRVSKTEMIHARLIVIGLYSFSNGTLSFDETFINFIAFKSSILFPILKELA